MDRRRRMPSYEEDMTPPRGMRGFRSNAVPTDEPMPGRMPRREEGAPSEVMRLQGEAEREMNRRLLQEPSMGTENSRGLLRSMGREDRFKKGGAVKKMASGGSVASKRADGCAARGKTKGRFV